MNSMMTMDRAMGMPMQGGMNNMMMVPRCTLKMEKCENGMKMMASCKDAAAMAMMKNLCTMLDGGMMSCHMLMNGMMVMACNMTMGVCKCEMTAEGMCCTWTSEDAKCCQMIQECCDCMTAMMACGCTCCVCMNGTPVCCC
ncbi:MAG: hypothetical protein PW734_11725 [Verrucomicrobium sp.]|nr:hypothetical protein [Verrucomicrobium sp.]